MPEYRKLLCWFTSKRQSILFDALDILILIGISILVSVISSQSPNFKSTPVAILILPISLKLFLLYINRLENPIDKIISLVNTEGSLGIVEKSTEQFVRIAETHLNKEDCVCIVTNSIHTFDMRPEVIVTVAANLIKRVYYEYYILKDPTYDQCIQDFIIALTNVLDEKLKELPKVNRDKEIFRCFRNIKFRRYFGDTILCNVALLKSAEKAIGFWYNINSSSPNNSIFLEIDDGNMPALEAFFSTMKKCSWNYDTKR